MAPRVTDRAGELPLEVGEGVDDVGRLVGSIAAVDVDLAHDSCVLEAGYRLIRGLEAPADQLGGARDRQNGRPGEDAEELLDRGSRP